MNWLIDVDRDWVMPCTFFRVHHGHSAEASFAWNPHAAEFKPGQESHCGVAFACQILSVRYVIVGPC